MKTIIISFCAIFLSFFLVENIAVAQSGKARRLFRDAEKSFKEENFQRAISLCEEAVSLSPDYDEARLLLGRSYFNGRDPQKAEEHLKKLIDSKYYAVQSKYWLAMSLKMQARYDEAIPYFKEFLSGHIGQNLQTAKAQIEMDGALNAIAAKMPESDDFEFRNLGSRVNSERSEFACAFEDTEKKLIISEESRSSNGENLRYLYAQGWMRVSENDEFDFLNTPNFEGACTVDPGGEIFYFTQCQNRSCRIMQSVKRDGIWLKAAPLPESINMVGSNSKDPALSLTGDTLFFASDRVGGMGGYDIWFSVKNGSHGWSNPVNLGVPINTPYTEMSPFESEEGTFYFSSNGHPGFGALDIFYAKGLNGRRQIINAGRPFNSSYNDQHIIVNSKAGYVASDRPGGLGDFDIYGFVNNHKKEIISKVDDLIDDKEPAYSSLFACVLYGIDPKFLPRGHEDISHLNSAEKKQLQMKVDDQLAAMKGSDKERIKAEDQLLYASLSREKRFFVDRLSAAYFESTSDILEITDDDSNWFYAMEKPEQRKLYRLMAANVADIQKKYIAQNTPLIVDEGVERKPDIKTTNIDLDEISQAPPISLVADYEPEENDNTPIALESTANTTGYLEIEKAAEDHGEVAVEMTKPVQNNEEAGSQNKSILPVARKNENAKPFTKITAAGTALGFYQNLSFIDKKRVDRIMAIKLVNEQYILDPGLSSSDRDYFHRLSNSEKEAIERLQLYFRSWDPSQESANLRESDIQYLASLPLEKRQKVTRIIVRRAIGIDSDQLVKFAGADWERYKKFSDSEIKEIKNVAGMLKKHDEFFDVALAYADENYVFDNDLALRTTRESKPILLASSDPEMVIEGIPHTYESVYFDAGEADLRNEAKAVIEDVAEIYRENPEIYIDLSAFSADAGDEADNLGLNNQRLQTAERFLIQNGVPQYKIRSQHQVLSAMAGTSEEMKKLESRKLQISILNSPTIFESEYTTYLVQPGNTLYSLSKANGTSVEELMALNGLSNSKILAYQPLRVKKTATLDPDFMVEPSLDLIYADAENTTSVSSEDDAQPKEAVQRGDEVMVFKVHETVKDSHLYHMVKKGERLKTISRLYGVAVKDLMRLNDLKSRRIKEGEKLLIEK